MKLRILVASVIALYIAGAQFGPAIAAGVTNSLSQRTTITLCAPTATPQVELKRDKVIVSRRVRHGFGFKQAHVTVASGCIVVHLAHPLTWIRWLAEDVASTGHFGIGVAYPNAKSTFTAGQAVRYKNDPVTSANANLPVVKVVLGRPAFIGWTAKLISRSGYEYVGVELTRKGGETLCAFTSHIAGGLAVVVLDRRVITDEQVPAKICGRKLLTGFPKQHTLDKPLGPRELETDLHSGSPLPVPLAITSLT